MLVLFVLQVFNPRAFIAMNKVERKNKTWADTLMFRQPKVSVLARSPNWKLQVKRAALLGEVTNASTSGRHEEVDGVASVVEVDAGYVITTDDDKFWAGEIKSGYVCGRAFYPTPHPSQYEVVDVLGCFIVLVVGMFVSFTVVVPNLMDFLIYKEVSTEKTAKYKKFAYVSLIIGSVLLILISFIATDLVLEQLGSPHMMKIVRNKCYVINNYTDKWTNNGAPEVAKAIYNEVKMVQRAALQRKMLRKLAKGKIANSTRNWRLYDAGLLADTEKVFIQQASMTDIGGGKFRFRVPCGAAVTSVSTKEGVPQVSYKWIPNITYSSEDVEMTLIEEAKAQGYVWCRGSEEDKYSDVDSYVSDGGFDYGYGSPVYDWFVWCTTCFWSRQYGRCLFKFKYSPAGNFVLRKVIEAPNGGYLTRGEHNPVTGEVKWSELSKEETSMMNFTTVNTYADRKGGWLENMSHTIMQEGWKGWDIENRYEEMVNWRSSMVPSQNEGLVRSTLNGRGHFSRSGKQVDCTFDIDTTASARVTNDTCYSEFDLQVDPGTSWVETADHCKAVYASKVGDKISVSVDNTSIDDDRYCGVTLIIGEIEKVYYIRPAEPWVGYKLDAWSCRSDESGIRGTECSPGIQPQAVNYEVFDGLFPTVISSQTHYAIEETLLGSLKGAIVQAVGLAIVGILSPIIVFLCVKLGMKLCNQAAIDGAQVKVSQAIANRKIAKENAKAEELDAEKGEEL